MMGVLTLPHPEDLDVSDATFATLMRCRSGASAPRGLPSSAVVLMLVVLIIPSDSRRPAMSESDGSQFVGIDLHRRISDRAQHRHR